MQLGEYFGLSNLFIEVINCDQTGHIDRWHLDSSDIVKITSSGFPHVNFELNKFSKCCYPSYQSYRTCQEFKAL